MVARADAMFGAYGDSYSYRLWSLANVWTTCNIPPLTGGEDKSPVRDDEESLGVVANSTGRGRRSPSLPLGPGGPYTCSQCGGAYPSRELLDKHELLHSPSTQSCKICNKSFANVYRLQRHMISHDESALLRKFKCNDCDKAFKFKHHLKEHLRIHSGEKPFECGNCGKKFSHSGSYSSHMTSKKCLVMNLKMGRIRPNNPALNPERSPSRKKSLSQMNNNIVPNNNNAFLSMLPNKYNEAAAAFLASITPRDGGFTTSSNHLAAPPLHPLYMPPNIPLHHPSAIAPFSLPASISHLIEQITSSQYLPRKLESDILPKRSKSPHYENEEAMEEINEEDDKRSSLGDERELVMDIDEEESVKIKQERELEDQAHANTPTNSYTERNSPNCNINNGPLGGLNMILESVNASVTKHLLQANMHKLSPHSATTCQDIAKSPPMHPIKQDPDDVLKCNNCNKTFNHKTELLQHEQVLCGKLFRKHEGLAAQVAETLALNRMEAEIHASMNSGISGSDDDEYSKETDGKVQHENERKVRVRTAISDEQQTILKEFYSRNQRPNREEFKKIAQRLGLDNRVVQVWFQNNRARVRRLNQSLSYTEQPLDLSTKKNLLSTTSSPSTSPCNISTIHSDSGEEAVNLSQKSSRSPTPYHNLFQCHYQHSNCSSSSLIDYRHSPSPNDLPLNGTRLPQKSPNTSALLSEKSTFDADGTHSPSINVHVGLDTCRASSSSPGSEKRSWTEETRVSHEIDEDQSKKGRIRTGMVENKEPEGQFICNQCDKAFVKQSSLARHKYEHSGQRPYKCVECPKAFKHKHHLTEHKRLHTGEKPFQCSKCLKKFSHSGSYSQHMNHRYSYCKPYRE